MCFLDIRMPGLSGIGLGFYEQNINGHRVLAHGGDTVLFHSDLLLFDALDVEKGPIATINVPIRLRFGLHGNFASAEDIGLAA